MKIPDKTYNERLAKRLREIMNILGMTVSGFAEFIGRDSSHIYGILNLTRLDIMSMLTPPLDILTPLSRLSSVQLMT